MEPKGLGFPVFVGQWGSVYDVGHEAEEQVFKKKKKNRILLFMVLFSRANVVQGNMPCGGHG